MPRTGGRSRRRRSAYTSPPRSLKAPVGVWFSCFTHTSAPHRSANSGHAYCGVPGKLSCTSASAASSSTNENIAYHPKSGNGPPPELPATARFPMMQSASVELQIGGRRLAAFHHNIVAHLLAVIQAFQPGRLHGGDVHEYILAAILRHD